MLPDETLRIETRLFTTLNRYLLLGSILLCGAYLLRARLRELPPLIIQLLAMFDRGGLWVTLVLTLLPLAMTMAMIWKIKEVILASIFGPGTAN
jgi:hypothetical protein